MQCKVSGEFTRTQITLERWDRAWRADRATPPPASICQGYSCPLARSRRILRVLVFARGSSHSRRPRP